MDPNQCSVLIVNSEGSSDTSLSSLYSVFADVTTAKIGDDAIEKLQARQIHSVLSTLVLIDIENHTHNDDGLQFLKTIVQKLETGLLVDTVPVVCSSHDSPKFMIECLRYGAADFLLKPLEQNVVKTLFLNVHRYQLKHGYDHVKPLTKRLVSGNMWTQFQDRLKGIFMMENWLSRTVVEYYTPQTPNPRRLSERYLASSRRAYLKSQVCRWDFLPLELTDEDLIHCAYLLFEHVLNHPELEALRVPEDDLYQFLFDIYNSYHSKNPYHNFRHAVDVLQATYYFLCRIGATTPIDSDPTLSYQQPVHTLLRPLNVFALLLASIGHDVGHPGVNNMFMVNTATPLAILYNDRSVLESFHSMAFYHILQQHCFSQITDIRNHPEYASFRSIIVSSILATDMSLHDEYVQKIRDQAERIRTNEFNPNDEVQCERERLILCGALIKCADISNCARPFSSAKRWAQYLAEEFFQQGDLEKELGLSVMPMNERGKLRLEDFQLSFKRHIALKLFQAVSDVTKEMSFTLDYINENINYWEIMKNDSGLGGEMEPLEKSNPYRAGT